MNATKKICGYCGDIIKGPKHKNHFFYRKGKIATVDTGCFLLLKERGLVRKKEESWLRDPIIKLK